MISGALTALITPMREGDVHLSDLCELVEWQIDQGIDGLVACGTTAETPTLTKAEQASVIRTVVEQAKGRVPVIAGAGTNDTQSAIALSQAAAELGVDGLLHVTPYYSKPPQRGLKAHFLAIAEAVDLPIVLYNVPGRTGCDLLPATVAELASHPRIVAVKEASGSLLRGQALLAACADQTLAVLSGDDHLCMPLTLLGGAGVISVMSNVAPKQTAQMIAHARAGELLQARALHFSLLPLMDLLFVEANPIPVKAAMAALGFGANELRSPLAALAGDDLERLKAELTRQVIAR